MPARKLTSIAVLLALLAFTAPARAVTIDGLFNGIMISGGTVGAPVSGTFSYNTATFYPQSGLDLEGYGITWSGPIASSFTLNGNTTSNEGIYHDSIGVFYGLSSNPNAFTVNLMTEEFSLSFAVANLFPNQVYGTSNVITFSGIVNGTGNANGVDFALDSTAIYPTPLPPALPMFAVALLALAVFGAWSRRAAE